MHERPLSGLYHFLSSPAGRECGTLQLHRSLLRETYPLKDENIHELKIWKIIHQLLVISEKWSKTIRLDPFSLIYSINANLLSLPLMPKGRPRPVSTPLLKSRAGRGADKLVETELTLRTGP
ncbi:hypothetical protein EVAR_18715_1 [Eumeta japonica]|uniref:Uncharacterized protein n=1 Tax=Eumeta variegata TaxID=151549 RepID=A0A4C1UNH2_EUMVA|nr:hypothetical protein EVAR_18715_1 [Eumeta japonica]